MTERERVIETLLFGNPDRVPLLPTAGRRSTHEVWHQQGLPEEVAVENIPEYAYRLVGGKLDWPAPSADARGDFYLNDRMMPQFEEKILEQRERTHVVQDWKGNICEISAEYGPEYLRNAIDFVTRSWIKCPIANRLDWQDMKRRYQPEHPARLPDWVLPNDPTLAQREWFLEVNLPGPFWQLREWIGFENLCLMFHDDPDFVCEMVQFWENYIIQLLKRCFDYVVPDCVHISEDMAFKRFSMISPSMVREFLLPTWTRWGRFLQRAGVTLYALDSDGFVGELIPLWIEAGINVCDPIEVAAGNNLPAYRRRFWRRMAYRGGVDKRAMAVGGGLLEEEMQRIRSVVEDGGYIPQCDHAIPPDVSWSHYLCYVRRLAELTGWL